MIIGVSMNGSVWKICECKSGVKLVLVWVLMESVDSRVHADYIVMLVVGVGFCVGVCVGV